MPWSYHHYWGFHLGHLITTQMQPKNNKTDACCLDAWSGFNVVGLFTSFFNNNNLEKRKYKIVFPNNNPLWIKCLTSGITCASISLANLGTWSHFLHRAEQKLKVLQRLHSGENPPDVWTVSTNPGNLMILMQVCDTDRRVTTVVSNHSHQNTPQHVENEFTCENNWN